MNCFKFLFFFLCENFLFSVSGPSYNPFEVQPQEYMEKEFLQNPAKYRLVCLIVGGVF